MQRSRGLRCRYFMPSLRSAGTNNHYRKRCKNGNYRFREKAKRQFIISLITDARCSVFRMSGIFYEIFSNTPDFGLFCQRIYRETFTKGKKLFGTGPILPLFCQRIYGGNFLQGSDGQRETASNRAKTGYFFEQDKGETHFAVPPTFRANGIPVSSL